MPSRSPWSSNLLPRPGFDFFELLLDSLQRDAALATEDQAAANVRPNLPQAIAQLVRARLNLVSELVGAFLQGGEPFSFVHHVHLRFKGGVLVTLPASRHAEETAGENKRMGGREMSVHPIGGW